MHPLFVAHLVADFLLQPTQLVKWKEKDLRGVIAHALIHGVVMALFVGSLEPLALLIIALIALSHGIIDETKIRYQRHRKSSSFALPFLLDQVAHATIILAASMLFGLGNGFWLTQEGEGMLLLTIFFTFCIAWWNLSHHAALKLKTSGDYVRLLLILGTAFLLFFTPAKLLASSICYAF